MRAVLSFCWERISFTMGDGVLYLAPVRYVCPVSGIQNRVVAQNAAELFDDVRNQTVFVLRHVHFTEEDAQEIADLPDFLEGHGPRPRCWFCRSLFMRAWPGAWHSRAVVALPYLTVTFCSNEFGNHGRDVDLRQP